MAEQRRRNLAVCGLLPNPRAAEKERFGTRTRVAPAPSDSDARRADRVPDWTRATRGVARGLTRRGPGQAARRAGRGGAHASHRRRRLQPHPLSVPTAPARCFPPTPPTPAVPRARLSSAHQPAAVSAIPYSIECSAGGAHVLRLCPHCVLQEEDHSVRRVGATLLLLWLGRRRNCS